MWDHFSPGSHISNERSQHNGPRLSGNAPFEILSSLLCTNAPPTVFKGCVYGNTCLFLETCNTHINSRVLSHRIKSQGRRSARDCNFRTKTNRSSLSHEAFCPKDTSESELKGSKPPEKNVFAHSTAGHLNKASAEKL